MIRIKAIVVTAILASIIGCDSDQLPVGSSIEVFPREVSWTIGGSGNSCDIENGLFNDQIISLSLLDSDSRGILEFPVELSLDLSGNTFNGVEVLSLFHDSNSDGIYSEDEKVSFAGGPVFRANTGRLNGDLDVMVRVNLSCAYTGNLYAFSGGVGDIVSFVVTEGASTVVISN